MVLYLSLLNIIISYITTYCKLANLFVENKLTKPATNNNGEYNQMKRVIQAYV